MQVVGENIGILVHRPILKNIDRTAAQNIHRLLNAAAQKIHLQIERPTIHIVVEIPDVGIVALLVIGLGAVALGQHLGQRGFAAADISGYRNVHKSDVLTTSRTSRRTAGPLPGPAARQVHRLRRHGRKPPPAAIPGPRQSDACRRVIYCSIFSNCSTTVRSLRMRGSLFLPVFCNQRSVVPGGTAWMRGGSSAVCRLAS